jgi:hypothetical protein
MTYYYALISQQEKFTLKENKMNKIITLLILISLTNINSSLSCGKYTVIAEDKPEVSIEIEDLRNEALKIKERLEQRRKLKEELKKGTIV